MADAADWRTEITKLVGEVWPDLPKGPFWIEAQVSAESGGNPDIKSPVGAGGLLQLMPGTAAELGLSPSEIFIPERNLRAGITYLKRQYARLDQIPMPSRLFWAFASYNAGYGYIRKALKLAEADGDGDWRNWDLGRFWLMHRECEVNNRRPYYKQTWHYVRRIRSEFTKRASSVEGQD